MAKLSLMSSLAMRLGLSAAGILVLAPALLLGNTPARAADDFSHGANSVRIVDVPSKTDPDVIEDQTLELLHGRKVVSGYSVAGYIRDAYWSPDGKWVAVNVRHANSGDYMWLLDVTTGKAVRRPSDDVEDAWETAAFAAFKSIDARATPDTMMHYWKFAKGWTADGKLEANVAATYADDIGRFEYVIPMTVAPGGLTAGEAKVTHEPLE